MDVRPAEPREPSHIHVPRPSRVSSSGGGPPLEYGSVVNVGIVSPELGACPIGRGDVSAAD